MTSYLGEELPSEFDLHDWIPIFSALEENDSLSNQVNVRQRLKNHSSEIPPEKWMRYDIGENETVYEIGDKQGSLRLRWGTPHVKNDSMLIGESAHYGNHRGEAVAEAEADIARQHPAPYITDVRSTDDWAEIDIRVPLDYNIDDWEETIDSLVSISEEVAQYQNELQLVTQKYLK